MTNFSFALNTKTDSQCTFELFSPLPLVTNLRGTTFSEAAHMLDGITEGMHFDLVRLPNNPFDHNAIAVYGTVDGQSYLRYGYIPRDVAADVAPIMDKGQTVKCLVVAVTGGGNYNVGVSVRLY